MADDNNRSNRETDELTRRVAQNMAEQVIQARTLTEELKDQLGIRSRQNEEEKALLSLSRQISKLASENNTVLRRAGRLNSQLISDKKAQAAAEREIAVFAARNRENYSDIKEEASELLKISRRSADELDQALKNVTNEEAKRLLLLYQIRDTASDVVANREEEIKFSHKVNENLGITGALLDNLDKLGVRFLGGIGLNLGIFAQGIEEAKDEADALAESFARTESIQQQIDNLNKEDAAYAENRNRLNAELRQAAEVQLFQNTEYAKRQKEINDLRGIEGELTEEQKSKLTELTAAQDNLADSIIEGNSELDSFDKKMAVIKAAAPGVGRTFKAALNDPATLAVISLDQLGKAFKEVNKASVDLSRATGRGVQMFDGLNASFATTAQIAQTAVEFTRKIGINASAVFTDRTLQQAAEFKNILGLASEEAFGLAFQAEAFGRSMFGVTDSIVDQVSAFNRTNRSAISQEAVLKDVAKAAEGISASLGGNPKALAEAAAAARRLGLELNELDKVANSILDFESSIEAELSAQLITGRDINLSKARELALSNDLAGVGEELFKNSANIAEFGRMGRIEQESMAQALGLTRDQLARVAYQRALENHMTAEQASLAAGVKLEDMERLEAMESINLAMQKFAQALVGPAEALASMASNSFTIYTAMAAMAGISMTRLVAQLALAAGSSIAMSTALTFGAGTAIIVAGILAAAAATNKAQESIDDGVVQNGKVVTTHPEDYLIATRDPRGLANAVGGTADLSPLTRKIDELIRVTRETGAVYIDSNKLMQVANTSGVSNYS